MTRCFALRCIAFPLSAHLCTSFLLSLATRTAPFSRRWPRYSAVRITYLRCLSIRCGGFHRYAIEPCDSPSALVKTLDALQCDPIRCRAGYFTALPCDSIHRSATGSADPAKPAVTGLDLNNLPLWERPFCALIVRSVAAYRVAACRFLPGASWIAACLDSRDVRLLSR